MKENGERKAKSNSSDDGTGGAWGPGGPLTPPPPPQHLGDQLTLIQPNTTGITKKFQLPTSLIY